MKRAVSKLTFRIKWLAMSERSRYAYLGTRTQGLLKQDDLTGNQWLQKSYKPE